MMDRTGSGTASLADAMALLFHRFGPPSDLLHLRAFGNAFDPQQQVFTRKSSTSIPTPTPTGCLPSLCLFAVRD